MDDEQFIRRINRILADHRIRLPKLQAGEDATGPNLSRWAEFLELCVKNGVKLSDPRWARVTVEKERPATVLALEGSEATEPDADFRVGLQLLMGMLGGDETSES